jgi:hypothetical protein
MYHVNGINAQNNVISKDKGFKLYHAAPLPLLGVPCILVEKHLAEVTFG